MNDQADEIDKTARTAWAEDRSGGAPGMAAVCDVIANRVAIAKLFIEEHGRPHPLFGDGTFADCVTRPYQFSCWNDDDPNYDKLISVTTDDPDFAIAFNLATQAVQGTLIDTTKAATYYYAKTMRKPPTWAEGKTPCADIGNQLFFNNI